MRIDGRDFHTFTRSMPRPYHEPLHNALWDVGLGLCKEISGVQLAYLQSDEISLLLTDWDSYETQGWFDYEVQKMCSVAASIAAARFADHRLGRMATFDCRVWNLPKEEVTNYFIWRQNDCVRNSIQMLARCHFSHKELLGKSGEQIQELLFQTHGINWNDTPTKQKRGVCIKKVIVAEPPTYNRRVWMVDTEIPIFTKDREYVEALLHGVPQIILPRFLPPTGQLPA
jgi:tRNA(His) 5'-end guanylyltransferase